MRPEDAELVRRCLDGDTDAYGELVQRYQGAVFATAFYYVGRHGAAEDIAQDSLLAGYRSLRRLKDATKFGPWLKQVTCRTAANWLRRNSSRLATETPLPHKRTIAIEDAREGPRGRMERRERLDQVQRAIDTLPERHRLPVVLRYLQELSYQEISDYTGETKDEIRGVLQRAGRQLREVLSEEGPASGEGANWHRAHK